MGQTANTSTAHKFFMLGLLLMVGVTLVFAVKSKRSFNVSEIEVVVDKIKGQALISKKEIASKLNQVQGYQVVGTELKNLNPYLLEQALEKDSRISNAEIFVDKFNTLQVKVEQSLPIVRIQTSEQSYYLDQDGRRIRWSENGTIRVPVATGNIERYTEDYLEQKQNSTIYQIYDLALRINEDKKFLSPLIEQIHVEEDQDIVFVPKLGREKIHFGKFENIDNKFYRLAEFYRRGLPKEGWGKYEVLRLDFKDQVVGQKRYNQ